MSEEPGFLSSIFYEIVSSKLNLALVALIIFLVYKIIRSKAKGNESTPSEAEVKLPPLKRDFTVAELREFDGTGKDGRVLVAVNGNVFDVTKGKRFYGPGGPYAAFGGRDASRGLATFSVTSSDKLEYDDLSDLNSMEMDSVREWHQQFLEKYDLVGKLLKPGEEHTSYSDEEEESHNEASKSASSDGKAKNE